MVIATVKKKNGVAYGNYGCAAHLRKGSAICGNALLISERKIDAAIIEEAVVSQEFREKVAEEFYRRVEAARKRPRGERDTVEQSVREQEARVQKITEGFPGSASRRRSRPSSGRRRGGSGSSGRG